MIGKTISHYRILEKLGEGGMGVVYKAEDTKLERIVALKFLPPELTRDQEAKARFMHEARAASSLQDNNICAIHEIDETGDGQMFICMDCYEGETIKQKIERGRLEIGDAVGLANQIAQGLMKAHKHGLVHRDIKPANIIITKDGVAKIIDFGLAKLASQAKFTRLGLTEGTAAYMSPEQAQGETVDHRTDVWSLGAVLYEMVTGQSPFRGDYAQAIVYAILNEAPMSITSLRSDVPMELDRIVKKALAKAPEERYQQVSDMSTDLSALAENLRNPHAKGRPPAGMRQPSIAVLPFTNLSADKEQEYFCDGMAEEIINALINVKGLRVVARTSAFMFKDKHEDIREIGRKLNVETLLEGSVRKSGNRLRINAQLVNVSDGYDLWSEKFDRDMEDVFSIQDEISLAIVSELKCKLLGKERAAIGVRHTRDVEAYNSYLRGRYFWNKRTEAGFQKGLEYFQQAIERDPAYALAYAGMADCYNLLGWYCVIASKEAFPRARSAAERALEIDDDLAEALTSLAFATMLYDWRWEEAEREFRRAIELNPSYATGHHWYAEYLLGMGRMDEATMEAERALEFDPLSLIIRALFGLANYFSLQYDEAVKQCKRILDMNPNFVPAHLFLGMTYTKKSMFDEAIAEFQSAIALFGRSSLMLGALGYAYAAYGKQAEARKLLNELKQMSEPMCIPWYYIAAIYAGLGENDEAFEWLTKAHKERDAWLVFLKVDPIWESLHDDPRYTALLKEMKLEE